MSEILDIMKLNKDEYTKLVGDDIAENIRRQYYQGIVYKESPKKKPSAAIVWETLNSESRRRDTISRMVYFSAPNREVADALLEEYGNIAHEDNVKKTVFEMDTLSDDVRESLSDAGFKIQEKESCDLLFTVGDAISNKRVDFTRHTKNIIPVSQISEVQFKQWTKYCLYYDECGINDDLENLPKSWYDEDISCCAVLDDKILGMLLVHVFPNGEITPVLLFSTGKNATAVVLNMIRFFVVEAEKKYPKNTKIVVTRRREITRRLMDSLFPKKQGDIVMAGERKE